MNQVLVRDDDEPEVEVAVGGVEVDKMCDVVGDAGTCCGGVEPSEPGSEERGWL